MGIFDHLERRPDHKEKDPARFEIRRIVDLPIWDPLTPEELEEFCRQNVLAKAFDEGFRLFSCQAEAVMAFDLFGGGFYPIGVGWGKSLISLMIAERAYKNGTPRSLLLVPSQVAPQLVMRSIPWARQRVPLGVPFHNLAGVDKKKRLAFARSRRPGCYILPYSCLSIEDSEEILNLIEPGLIIADEAHLLKNSNSAKVKRIRRFIDKFEPQMAAMSGTITAKSILDYWLILRTCLGDNAPLPESSNLARQWAAVLDVQSDAFRPDTPAIQNAGFRTEPILPLVHWAEKHWPKERFPETIQGFRHAYKKRLTSAPGVVVTGDSEIGVSLNLRNEPVEVKGNSADWTKLQRLVADVKDAIAPNGDTIDHAIHEFGWLYQLSAGFYIDTYWPEPQKLADRLDIDLAEAEGLLDAAQIHHEAQQAYHSELRRWLGRRSRPGMDTPMLVGKEMSLNGAKNVGPELYEAWLTVRELDFERRPERQSRPVRVCDYKVKAAVKWAKTLPRGRGAVIWVHHQEVGKWLYEELRKADVDSLHCPAGDEHNVTVGDPANAHRVLVVSIGAHHIGKELQHFEFQYVLQWPRSAVVAEQMLGRLHRNGQLADSLTVITNNTGEVDDANFAACLNDACYIHDTTGVRQKLMVLTYETPPAIYDHATLRRMGLDPQRLTGEQLKLLESLSAA